MLDPFDISTRVREAEVMDDPALDADAHHRALVGLGRINRISQTADALWRAIREDACRSNRPLRLLDVATGGGDVPRRLAHLAQSNNIAMDIHACDVSRRAVAYARQQTRDVCVFMHDALRDALPRGFDIITCNLFVHHLPAQDAQSLLNNMAQAAQHMVVVSDLRRCPLGYAAARIGTQLLTRSPVVHVDGLRSVRAAFTMDEASQLAGRAGLLGATIQAHWPWRWMLIWRRS
jgi:2-polyprenyl-3-methyl-5-hydroxy-6-metoxy-1,4-benzoquinol methylase